MRFARLVLIPILVLALGGLTACSTGHRSERRGLFTQLDETPSRRDTRRGTGVSRDVASAVPLLWPLHEVQVTSAYGKRRDGFHEGIDLRAPSGTPVYAAQSGTVVYAGRSIRGYGRMIVLRHNGGIATVYAHNSKLLVSKGQRIYARQKIAISGSTGRARGPHLHFEIRKGVAPVDPMTVMPTVLARSAR